MTHVKTLADGRRYVVNVITDGGFQALSIGAPNVGLDKRITLHGTMCDEALRRVQTAVDSVCDGILRDIRFGRFGEDGGEQ